VRFKSIFFAATIFFTTGLTAKASLITVDFTINGPWLGFDNLPATVAPYGLPAQPTLSGDVTFDTTKSGASEFVGIDFTTGTKTWTLADIDPNASATISNGVLGEFALIFTGQTNFVFSNNTALLDDGNVGIFCNGCVVTSLASSVPEPSTWAMLLLGFAGIGFMACRRKSKTALMAV
jgi:hypothetical protein